MHQKLLGKVSDYLAGLRSRHTQDDKMLQWAVVTLLVLGLTVALQACGVLIMLDELQLRFLAGHPFYLTAEDAQVSLLSPGVTFSLCVGITLYLSAVLLRGKSMWRRTHVALLAFIAVGLPGVAGILWHGVFYVGQPLLCVVILWVLLVPGTLVCRSIRS